MVNWEARKIWNSKNAYIFKHKMLFEGRTCNDEGLLLYLPGRLGKMDINILSIPDIEYQSSKTTLKK